MLTRKTIFAVLSAAILIAPFFAGCVGEQKQIADEKKGFELRLLSGGTITARIEASEGRFNDLIIDGGKKPTLYVFFTTICPECAKETPHIIDMKERYKDSVNIIGVLVENKTAEEVADFVASSGINYPVAIGAGAFRLSDAVGGVRFIPAMHIYDAEGKYVAHFVGPTPQEMMETRIDALLNGGQNDQNF